MGDSTDLTDGSWGADGADRAGDQRARVAAAAGRIGVMTDADGGNDPHRHWLRVDLDVTGQGVAIDMADEASGDFDRPLFGRCSDFSMDLTVDYLAPGFIAWAETGDPAWLEPIVDLDLGALRDRVGPTDG